MYLQVLLLKYSQRLGSSIMFFILMHVFYTRSRKCIKKKMIKIHL